MMDEDSLSGEDVELDGFTLADAEDAGGEWDELPTDPGDEEEEDVVVDEEDGGEQSEPGGVINDNVAELDTTASVAEGDRVIITVIDGEPVVTGVVGGGDNMAEDIDEALATANAAAESVAAVTASNQHFWHNSADPETHGGAGAHVTDDTQEAWDAAVADGFSDLGDGEGKKPWYNVLVNSLGALWRSGLNNLVSITRSAVQFFDGAGNSAANVVASFGADGARVGKADQAHVSVDSDSVDFYGSVNNVTRGKVASVGVYQNVGMIEFSPDEHHTAKVYGQAGNGAFPGSGQQASVSMSAGFYDEGEGCIPNEARLELVSTASGASINLYGPVVSRFTSGARLVMPSSSGDKLGELYRSGNYVYMLCYDSLGGYTCQWRFTVTSGALHYRLYDSEGEAWGSWYAFLQLGTSRTANYVLAAPNGSAGAPSFRALVAADIPSLAASKITSGTFAAARIPTLSASKMGVVSLYNNTSGSTGTIALSATAANYTHMRIYAKTNDTHYFSCDVYSPNGKVVELSSTYSNADTIYVKTRSVKISGTSISTNGDEYGQMYVSNSAHSYSHSNFIYIVRVEAWN